MSEPPEELVEELRAAIARVELKCPKGWKPAEAGVYNKKRLRMVVTGVPAAMTVSISVNRNGFPCHPTDDQCQRALQAFEFDDAQEVPRTTSARYFKCQQKGLD